METLLSQLGIKTEQLYAKPIHNREETLSILGCTHRTLRKWENKGYLTKNRFKNKTYYTTSTIENCAKEQLGLQGWDGIWE